MLNSFEVLFIRTWISDLMSGKYIPVAGTLGIDVASIETCGDQRCCLGVAVDTQRILPLNMRFLYDRDDVGLHACYPSPGGGETISGYLPTTWAKANMPFLLRPLHEFPEELATIVHAVYEGVRPSSAEHISIKADQRMDKVLAAINDRMTNVLRTNYIPIVTILRHMLTLHERGEQLRVWTPCMPNNTNVEIDDDPFDDLSPSE